MNLLRVSVADERGTALQEPRVTDALALPVQLKAAVEHSSFVKCEYTYKSSDGVNVTVHVQRMIEVPSTLFYEPYNAHIFEALADGLIIHFTLSCGHKRDYHYRNAEDAAQVAQLAKGKDCQCEQCPASSVGVEVLQ